MTFAFQILQMIGRAGRPQFDTSATAIIMTTEQNKQRYENLVNGSQNVESFLHGHLREHLNSEIVLQTLSDITLALEWLKSTFFYVRVQKNPKQYGFPIGISKEEMERKLQELCVINLNALAKIKLVEMTEDIELKSTEAGRLMARFYVAYETMKNFSTLEGDEDLSGLVAALCKSKEYEDIQLRRCEKNVLNTLNKAKNKDTVRFQLDSKVKDKAMKVNILMQAQLGCLNIPEPGLQREALRIVQIGQRLAKCLKEFVWSDGERHGFKTLKSAIVLAKSLQAGIWNNSDFVSKQFERVGISYSTALVNAGLNTFAKLATTDARQMEMILNKQPPFGNHVKNAAAHMPEYDVAVERTDRGGGKITVTLMNEDMIREKSTAGRGHSCVLLVADGDNKVVCKTKVQDSLLLRAGKYEKELTEMSTVAWISETISGVDVLKSFGEKDDSKKHSFVKPKKAKKPEPKKSKVQGPIDRWASPSLRNTRMENVSTLKKTLDTSAFQWDDDSLFNESMMKRAEMIGKGGKVISDDKMKAMTPSRKRSAVEEIEFMFGKTPRKEQLIENSDNFHSPLDLSPSVGKITVDPKAFSAEMSPAVLKEFSEDWQPSESQYFPAINDDPVEIIKPTQNPTQHPAKASSQLLSDFAKKMTTKTKKTFKFGYVEDDLKKAPKTAYTVEVEQTVKLTEFSARNEKQKFAKDREFSTPMPSPIPFRELNRNNYETNFNFTENSATYERQNFAKFPMLSPVKSPIIDKGYPRIGESPESNREINKVTCEEDDSERPIFLSQALRDFCDKNFKRRDRSLQRPNPSLLFPIRKTPTFKKPASRNGANGDGKENRGGNLSLFSWMD